MEPTGAGLRWVELSKLVWRAQRGGLAIGRSWSDGAWSVSILVSCKSCSVLAGLSAFSCRGACSFGATATEHWIILGRWTARVTGLQHSYGLVWTIKRNWKPKAMRPVCCSAPRTCTLSYLPSRSSCGQRLAHGCFCGPSHGFHDADRNHYHSLAGVCARTQRMDMSGLLSCKLLPQKLRHKFDRTWLAEAPTSFLFRTAVQRGATQKKGTSWLAWSEHFSQAMQLKWCENKKDTNTRENNWCRHLRNNRMGVHRRG